MAWSGGRRPLGAALRWTEWTLAMTWSWWEYYKYRRGYYYYYYYFNAFRMILHNSTVHAPITDRAPEIVKLLHRYDLHAKLCSTGFVTWSPNNRDLHQLTIRYMRPYRNVFTRQTSIETDIYIIIASMNWNSGWFKFGPVLTRVLSIRVFEQASRTETSTVMLTPC